MNYKALLTIDDKIIFIYYIDRLKEADYIDKLKSFTKNNSQNNLKQNLHLVLFNTTNIKDFKEKIVTRLELEKPNAPTDTLIAIHLGNAKKAKKNAPLIETFLLLSNNSHSKYCPSQDLIDLSKNIKELLSL